MGGVVLKDGTSGWCVVLFDPTFKVSARFSNVRIAVFPKAGPLTHHILAQLWNDFVLRVY